MMDVLQGEDLSSSRAEWSNILQRTRFKYVSVSEFSTVLCSDFRFGRLINRDFGICPDSFSGREDW